MRSIALLALCAALASCATGPDNSPKPQMGTGEARPQSSAECLAANLKPSEPFTANLIPEAVLKKAQSGSVAMQYDVVNGKAQNVTVVTSNPPGLYDSYAVQHANRYREPSGKTVRGCIMTIDIKF
jgi:hypothetical protein